MTTPDAAQSGTFKIGGALTVNRLGFGAMRVTGKGIWGEPSDRAEALRTLHRLPALGVNFIDTADSYGPDVSEKLIHEALHPYSGLVIATKGGLLRPGPDNWVPQGEQFGAIKSLLDQGIIRHAGLSEVSVAEIEAASKVFKVATVQNRYNLGDRSSEDVLDYCEQHGIGFIPWYPLAAGELARPGTPLDAVAKAHGATPSQIALAWVLKRSPVMLPIPGTSKVAHLEENVAAAGIALTDAEFAELDRFGKSAGK